VALEKTPPGVLIGVGVFVGLLIGIVATIALFTPDTGETYEEYRQRIEAERTGRSRPAGGGQQPARPSGENPHGADGHGGAGADRASMSIAKVHFMKKFVAALTTPPQNMFPAADWKPLVKEGADPIRCADCHDPNVLNLEAMIRQDPGSEAVERFRRARRGFMIPLMTKWVQRLNTRHADRLEKPVTCTDCHAIDPRDDETRFRVLPPLMASFVSALKKPPTNKNPARDWKPLLKDPATDSMLCSVCHGRSGAMMERNLAQLVEPGRPEKYADDKAFMVNLMERWVERLNREASHLLTKAVVCRDCHDTDPRK